MKRVFRIDGPDTDFLVRVMKRIDFQSGNHFLFHDDHVAVHFRKITKAGEYQQTGFNFRVNLFDIVQNVIFEGNNDNIPNHVALFDGGNHIVAI